MKKNVLIAMLALLAFTNASYAANSEVNDMDINQKACQNVFSLINVDVSLMSPRGSAADVCITDTAPDPKIMPVADKQKPKPQVLPAVNCHKPECGMHPIVNKPEMKPPMPPQNHTSLFRLDLFHLIKLQIL